MMFATGKKVGGCSASMTEGFIVATSGHCRGIALRPDAPRYEKIFFVPEVVMAPSVIEAPFGVYELGASVSSYDPDVLFGRAVPITNEGAKVVLDALALNTYAAAGLPLPETRIRSPYPANTVFPAVAFNSPKARPYENFGAPIQFRTSKEMLKCSGLKPSIAFRTSIRCKMFEGSSGGPFYQQGELTGTNSVANNEVVWPAFFGDRVQALYRSLP
jgi:hypothetical protein